MHTTKIIVVFIYLEWPQCCHKRLIFIYPVAFVSLMHVIALFRYEKFMYALSDEIFASIYPNWSDPSPDPKQVCFQCASAAVEWPEWCSWSGRTPRMAAL